MVVGARRAGLSILKTADLLGFSRTTKHGPLCDSHGIIALDKNTTVSRYHGIAITGLKYVMFKCLGRKQQLFSPMKIIYLVFFRNI